MPCPRVIARLKQERAQLSLGFDFWRTRPMPLVSRQGALAARYRTQALPTTAGPPRSGSVFLYEASFSLIQKRILKPGASDEQSRQVGKSWLAGDPYQRFIARSFRIPLF